MELFARNTITGLVPLYPSDQDEKRKLKLGEDYKVVITRPRNVDFHRKLMALFNLGCENSKMNLPFEVYRKIMTMRAGYFTAYATDKGTHYEADSISFAKMSQDTFDELYSRVIDVIIKDIGSTKEEIQQALIDFM